MIGDSPRSNPTIQVPPWDFYDDHPMANIHSPFSSVTPRGNAINFNDFPVDNLTAFQRYLPSNTLPEDDVLSDTDELDIPVDTFSCDQFRMFEFKVTKCARARSHDWTECPYAHPGEKARRRDPRKFHYSGSACPDFRKGLCKKGDACEYAHGVFECWLHPARYRTQPCKDGTHCRRRVCFFAHTADQLRVLPHSGESYDGSPGRLGCSSPRMLGFEGRLGIGSSPTSVLHSPPLSPPAESPPMSPSGICLTDSMRNLQIGNRRMSFSLPSWGVQMGSPLSPMSIRPGFVSMPSTPTQNPTRYGPGVFDLWGKSSQEEPIMERVESGKDLRARMYAKLSKENSFDSSGPGPGPGPDFGWVSELVK